MRERRGFTATELVVAMGVSLLLSVAGWAFYRGQLRSLSAQAAELEAAESARAALAFMSHEIRLAGLDPTGTAFPNPGEKGIGEATATRLSIAFDRNGRNGIEPNLSDPDAEAVTYAYDPAREAILRTVNGTAEVLIAGVPAGGFTLAYLDQNGAILSLSGGALSAPDRDRVRFVRIDLVTRGGSGGSVRTVRLSTRAALRNRILDRL